MKIRNIKDMENLRKKNEIESQNRMEGHSTRLEQVEERISESEDKIDIKGRNKELLVQQLKPCAKNMQ
jgi:hypothetical protein